MPRIKKRKRRFGYLLFLIILVLIGIITRIPEGTSNASVRELQKTESAVFTNADLNVVSYKATQHNIDEFQVALTQINNKKERHVLHLRHDDAQRMFNFLNSYKGLFYDGQVSAGVNIPNLQSVKQQLAQADIKSSVFRKIYNKRITRYTKRQTKVNQLNNKMAKLYKTNNLKLSVTPSQIQTLITDYRQYSDFQSTTGSISQLKKSMRIFE